MKLQLYSVNNRYAFTVGKFSSLNHFLFCPDIKPTYKYAWEAYRDAYKLYYHQYSQIDAINRYAADDLKISDLSAEKEVSAEDMIFNHYSKIWEIMVNRSKSFKDDKDKEIVYGEIKEIVSGIIKVKESLEKDTDKNKIEDILRKFRALVKEKFSQLLEKDKKEMESQKNKISPESPELSQTPQTPDNSLPIVPMAQVDYILKYGADTINDVRTEVLDEYAERICKCIEKYHPDAICKIDYKNGIFRINKAKGSPLLRICVNNDLNLQDIEPDGELSRAFPLHSLEFYQKYWKPIIEKIGHCLSKDLGILICPAKSSLPDVPNTYPHSVRVMGWNVNERAERPFEIYFGGEKPIWLLKKVDFIKESARKIRPSKYTEEDFIHGQPRRVQCIDPNLKSILGKIGEVVQVIPLTDHIELDVDFGRQIIRLTEYQIELILNEL